MKNAMLILAVVLLSGCGETFEERSDHFAEVLCTYAVKCAGASGYDRCYRDVTSDMQSAKAELDEAGQAACMECMQAKIDELEKSTNNACATPDDRRVIQLCGKEGDEACAGYP